MSPDEAFLVELFRILKGVHLEAIVVGSAAAVLQGAPLMTQDVDLLVRDTPLNREKLEKAAVALNATRPRPISDLTNVVRLNRSGIDVDILFDRLTPTLSFEGIRARAVNIVIGDVEVSVASLTDVISAKETAGRPKDLAQLPIIRATAAVRQKL